MRNKLWYIIAMIFIVSVMGTSIVNAQEEVDWTECMQIYDIQQVIAPHYMTGIAHRITRDTLYITFEGDEDLQLEVPIRSNSEGFIICAVTLGDINAAFQNIYATLNEQEKSAFKDWFLSQEGYPMLYWTRNYMDASFHEEVQIENGYSYERTEQQDQQIFDLANELEVAEYVLFGSIWWEPVPTEFQIQTVPTTELPDVLSVDEKTENLLALQDLAIDCGLSNYIIDLDATSVMGHNSEENLVVLTLEMACEPLFEYLPETAIE